MVDYQGGAVGCPSCGDTYWDHDPGDGCPDCGVRLVEIKPDSGTPATGCDQSRLPELCNGKIRTNQREV